MLYVANELGESITVVRKQGQTLSRPESANGLARHFSTLRYRLSDLAAMLK